MLHLDHEHLFSEKVQVRLKTQEPASGCLDRTWKEWKGRPSAPAPFQPPGVLQGWSGWWFPQLSVLLDLILPGCAAPLSPLCKNCYQKNRNVFCNYLAPGRLQLSPSVLLTELASLGSESLSPLSSTSHGLLSQNAFHLLLLQSHQSSLWQKEWGWHVMEDLQGSPQSSGLWGDMSIPSQEQCWDGCSLQIQHLCCNSGTAARFIDWFKRQTREPFSAPNHLKLWKVTCYFISVCEGLRALKVGERKLVRCLQCLCRCIWILTWLL